MATGKNMSPFDDKITATTVSAPSFGDFSSLVKSGVATKIGAIDKLTPAVQRFEDEKRTQETDSFKMQLLTADELPTEQRADARRLILANAERDGSAQWFNKGDIAKELMALDQRDATEGRAIADQLIQQETHDRLEEQANYDITQRSVLEKEKDLQVKELEQTLKNKEAEEGRLKAEEIRKKSDWEYATRPELRARTEAKAVRTEDLAKEEHKDKMVDHESSDRINNIFRDTSTAVAFNAKLKVHMESGFTDPNGRLKTKANEYAKLATTAIDTEKIYNTVGRGNINNTTAYTRATYNQIIDEEYKRLKKLHPFADDKVLLDNAHAAVRRTEAGTMFEQQNWYEKLTAPEADAERTRRRTEEVKKNYTEKLKETVSAFSDMDKAGRNLVNTENFRTKLGELNYLYEQDPSLLGDAAKNRITQWNGRAIADYVQNDFRPVNSYEMANAKYAVMDNGERVKVPLRSPQDYSPSAQKDWIDTEVKKIMTEFPLADRELATKSVLNRIKNSPLAVKFAEGALPAALQKAKNQFRFETAKKRSERRHNILQGIAGTKGNSVHAYTNDFLKKKFASEGNQLNEDQKRKLSKELSDTISLWKGWIPEWKNLPMASKETYQIAMVDLLSGAVVDKDGNFLWMDPDDFALANIQGAKATGDMSGAPKNVVLTALAGAISPYGTGVDSTGRTSGPPNSVLLRQLEAAVEKANEEKKKKIQESVKKLADSPL